MADFFLQPSTFDESRNARPLVEAFLVTILGECPLSFTHSSAGYRTGRLWITIDELRDVSMARQSLENELQRAILEGKAFRQSRFADGSLCRASRAMTANFATNSSDRQALLRAYREVSQVGTTLQDTADAVGHRSLFCGHDAGYRGARQIQEEPKFCLLPQPRWGGSMPLRASSFIYGTAWKYNPACTINERNAIIASIKSWAKSDKLGQVQYHSWTPREDLYLFKWVRAALQGLLWLFRPRRHRRGAPCPRHEPIAHRRDVARLATRSHRHPHRRSAQEVVPEVVEGDGSSCDGEGGARGAHREGCGVWGVHRRDQGGDQGVRRESSFTVVLTDDS
jgi:hypothetical protein